MSENLKHVDVKFEDLSLGKIHIVNTSLGVKPLPSTFTCIGRDMVKGIWVSIFVDEKMYNDIKDIVNNRNQNFKNDNLYITFSELSKFEENFLFTKRFKNGFEQELVPYTCKNFKTNFIEN
ncbi:MAG: hypothetical protein V1874_08770 [Spirochaetota bacterium]